MISTMSTRLLYNGDCFDVMNNIQDKSIDMILCDLPYNCTAQEWDKEINLDLLWNHYERVRKDDCPVVLFASQPFTTKLISSNIKNFKYINREPDYQFLSCQTDAVKKDRGNMCVLQTQLQPTENRRSHSNSGSQRMFQR